MEDASGKLANSGFERLRYPALKQRMRLAANSPGRDYMMALLDLKIINNIFVIPKGILARRKKIPPADAALHG
jgi:hypothetical protein